MDLSLVIKLQYKIIDSSIIQKHFSLIFKCLSCNWGKNKQTKKNYYVLSKSGSYFKTDSKSKEST